MANAGGAPQANPISVANGPQGVANGLNAASAATQQAMGFNPAPIASRNINSHNLAQNAAQVSGQNLSPYQNPFTDQVVNASLGDMNRMRQMALNDVGAQATSAGAFGGARHGLLEAETNRAYMDQAGLLGSQLRSQGFNTALATAGQDVDRQQQTNLANQNMGLQAWMANQGADLQAQMANQQAGFQAAGNRLAGANQLGNLANLGFGMQNQINSDLSRQGAQQQAVQQQLIDAARGQYQGFTSAPERSLSLPLAALGAAPNQSTSTTSQQPGLLNFLSLGLGLL